MRADPGALAYAGVVVDTNVLLSAAMLPTGVPAAFVDRILQHGRLIFSPTTYAEFENRVWKPKFDRYLSMETRGRLLHDFGASAIWVEIPEQLSARRFSRDPDDDAFVQAALAAQAKRLVTGDDDLLVLGTIEFVSIISPRAALDELDALEIKRGTKFP